MCSSDAPAAPTAPAGLDAAAQAQLDIGQDYLDFAKDQFKVSEKRQIATDAQTKKISDNLLKLGASDRKRYEDVFVPLQDKFIKEAENYDSPERQRQVAAEARADVSAEAASQKGARQREAMSLGMGIGGRFAGIERAGDLMTASQSVHAQNTRRQEVRDKGVAMRRDAIGLGQGLGTNAITTNQAAGSLINAGNDAFFKSQGIVQPGYSSAQQGAAGQATTLGQTYRSDIGIWDTNRKIGAAEDAAVAKGIGEAVGTGVGVLAMLSSKKSKKNRKKVPEGESLAAVEGMPVEAYDYKEGMGDGGSHVGPMAEDFQQQTGAGDGTSIAMQDAIGVTMGAVKDLSSKVDKMAEMIGLGGAASAPA